MAIAKNTDLTMTTTKWQYLEKRPHAWRQQLYFKERRLRPFNVWITMQIEQMSPEEAASEWDLPIAAIKEAIAYCEANRELLDREAESERQYLEEKGISLEPKIARG
jgi:uncharacterized protein (DUF433 family)